jgi:hypothetical protein
MVLTKSGTYTSVAELETILWAGQAKRKAKKIILNHT